jgi:hypothetical protein
MSINYFILQQADFDMLLVNLRMDAVNVKENMRINWVSESGIVENIMQIIKEYKDSRKLQVTCVFKTNLYDFIEIKHECNFF